MEILNVLQQIQADISALSRQPKPDVVYFLDAVTPYAQVRYPDGRTFKIRQDGRTTAEVAGLDLPCPCPYPDAIWRLGTAVFFRRHRKRLPLAVIALFALASLQLLIATIPGAPGAAWFLDYFAAAMNAVLITLASLCVVAFALHNFGRGIDIRFGQPDTDTALLSAGQIDIAPDIHVFSLSDSEQPDIFAQRVRDAYTDMLPRGQYLLILTYRCPSGIVVRFPDTGSQEYFERANLVKTIPGWMQEVCPPTRFDRETFAEFSAYCVAFCEQFRVWSQTDKMKQGNPVKDFLHSMEAAAQKAAVILALLLCPLFASAQSAVPIPTNAGQSIFQGTLPDSVEVEKLKLGLLQGKSAVAKETRPTRLFSMWMFHRFILPVFALFAIVFWIVAKSAFRESEHDNGGNVIFGIGIAERGHWARRAVWAILTLTAVIEISAGIIDNILTKENLWPWFFWWVIQAFIAYLLITHLTPNPRKVDSAPMGQGFPMVGGGQKRIG